MKITAVLNFDAGELAEDIAEVNGLYFINNSSIGMYPRLVCDRECQRLRFGRGKWPAMAIAVFRALGNPPGIRVIVDAGQGEHFQSKASFVFVGNNRYEFNRFSIGNRSVLDAGVLSLYMSGWKNRWGLISLAADSVLGRLDQARDFVSHAVPGLRIEMNRKEVSVALDGEVISLAPPLNYTIHPRGLRVIAPPADSK